MVLPAITKLTNFLKELKSNENLKFGQDLIDYILKEFDRRCEEYYADKDYILAAISHPDQVLRWTRTSEEKENAINLLREAVAEIEVTNVDHPVEKKQKSEKFSLDASSDEDETHEMDEVSRWILKKKHKNFDSFPTIRKVFLKYNTALPSQATCERLFSFGRKVFGLSSFRYNDDTFEQRVMVKANSKLIPEIVKYGKH